MQCMDCRTELPPDPPGEKFPTRRCHACTAKETARLRALSPAERERTLDEAAERLKEAADA